MAGGSNSSRDMWIKALRIKDFGVLGTGEFQFSPGINVLYGPNEAGKTTLFDALEKALFGQVRGPRRYGGRAEVLLTSEEGEFLVKDGKGRPPPLKGMKPSFFESLFFVRTGELGFVDQKGFLQDLKGRLLDTERLYRAMEHIKTRLGRGLNPLGENLRREGELTQELERLRREVEELEAKRARLMEAREDLVRLEGLKEEFVRLEAEREELRGKVELRRKVLEKQALRERYKNLMREKEEIGEAEALREKLKGYEAFGEEELLWLKEGEEELNRLSERVRSLRGRQEEISQEEAQKEEALGRLKEELRDLKVEQERLSLRLQALEGAEEEGYQRLLEIDGHLEALQGRLEGRRVAEGWRGLQAAEERLRRRASRLTRLGWLAGGLWALGGFLLLLGIVKAVPFPLGGGLMVAGGLCWLWLRRLRMAAVQEAQRVALEADLLREREEILTKAGVRTKEAYRERLDELKEVQEGLKTLEMREENLLQRQRGLEEDLKGLKEKVKEVNRALQEAQREEEVLREEREGRLRQKGLASLKELEEKVLERKELEGRFERLKGLLSRKASVLRELQEVGVRLKELEEVPAEMPEGAEVERRFRDVEERFQGLQREIHRLQGRIEERERGIGVSESELFSKLWELRRRLEEREGEWKDLFRIYRFLKELEGRLETSLMKLLEGKALEWFSFIVGGGPLELRFERSDIKVSFGSRTMSVEELSSGTRDPLYFAARVAMAERAAGLRTLLLDDPFLTCDPSRTRRLVDLLERLSERFQILLATKDPWLRDLFDPKRSRLLELPPQG